MKRSITGKKGQRPHQDKKSWFDEHGIQGFAAGSHSFETAPCIESRDDTEKFPQSQYIGKKHKIAFKRDKPFVLSKRDHKNGHKHGGKMDAGCYLENKTRGFAVHRTLFEQPDDVFDRLKDTGSLPA